MPADLIRFPASEDVHRRAVAAFQNDVATEVAKALRLDRARTAALMTVADQARRFGVLFNLAEAVESGMTVDDAREFVMAVACGDQN